MSVTDFFVNCTTRPKTTACVMIYTMNSLHTLGGAVGICFVWEEPPKMSVCLGIWLLSDILSKETKWEQNNVN